MMFTPPKLTVSGVFSKLKEIAGMSGSAVSDLGALVQCDSVIRSSLHSPLRLCFISFLPLPPLHVVLLPSLRQKRWILSRACLLPAGNLRLGTSSGEHHYIM